MSGIIAQNSGRHTGLVKAASAGGVWNLIETLTASASGTLDFTSGIDSTYDEYVFKFINIHPGTAETALSFNMSVDTGSNYDAVAKTIIFFRANHREDDGSADFAYRTSEDLAQGTGFQVLSAVNGAGNDEALSGTLTLFGPSSTTFVKHFTAQSNAYQIEQDISNHSLLAGMGNTTSAVDAIQFKMTSGNIDAGTISLYGIT